MDDNKKNIPSGLDGTFDKRDLLCDRGRGGRAVHGLDLFEVLYAANAVGHIVDHLAILEHSAVSFHLALDGAETVAECVVEERNHFIVHFLRSFGDAVNQLVCVFGSEGEPEEIDIRNVGECIRERHGHFLLVNGRAVFGQNARHLEERHVGPHGRFRVCLECTESHVGGELLESVRHAWEHVVCGERENAFHRGFQRDHLLPPF